MALSTVPPAQGWGILHQESSRAKAGAGKQGRGYGRGISHLAQMENK